MSRHKRELSVAAAYGALLLLLAFVNPAFFSGANLRTIAVREAATLVAAIGMTLVILIRQVDISIGSQFSVCGVVAALLGHAGLPLPLVLGGTLLTGAALGALNGLLVAFLGLPSIVVTLSTMVTLEASLKWVRGGEAVRNLPPTFHFAGLGQTGGQAAIVGAALVLFAAFVWGLRHLAAGRAVYATGSSAEAARLAGIRPRRVLFAVFTGMGLLVALAAFMTAIQFRTVQPNEGKGLELKVIAAVVVGGVAISGGRGTLWGVLAGVLFLGSIGTALVFLRTESYWEKAIQGAILLVAVASDALNLRRTPNAGARAAPV